MFICMIVTLGKIAMILLMGVYLFRHTYNTQATLNDVMMLLYFGFIYIGICSQSKPQ